MKQIKAWLSAFVGAVFFIILFRFKREQSEHKKTKKALEASKIEISAAKETLNAMEIKRNVENRNKRDPRPIDERLRDKGYLRNDP